MNSLTSFLRYQSCFLRSLKCRRELVANHSTLPALNDRNGVISEENQCSVSDSSGNLEPFSRPSFVDKLKKSRARFQLRPSFNLSAYADKSPLIQDLVKLGVDLSLIERRGAGELILGLDFDRDVKPYIQFLHDRGVAAEDIGLLFTKNPYILKEDLENLQIRINYLEAKLFMRDSIVRIITKNPKWLTHSTKDIDRQLGFLQSLFKLSGHEVRHLTTRMPQLITLNTLFIETTRFGVVEEMGFTEVESKSLLLNKPKIYSISRNDAVGRFVYVHSVMGLPHSKILSEPTVLTYRKQRIRERHEFLMNIGKAQYDPTQPRYVSMKALLSGSDVEFCRNVAKTPIMVFNKFLKTL